MTLDILTTWPRRTDYPLFRRLMQRARPHYRRLIVSFTGPADAVLESYVRAQLPDALFAAPVGTRGDWRHVAVSNGLALSEAEFVLFLEQDFFIRHTEIFFGMLERVIRHGACFIGFRENERIHPACLLVERAILDKTSLDFSAGDAGHDHFWAVTAELSGLAEFVSLKSLGLERGRDWAHMAGLTHNYDLARRGEAVTYRPVDFALYNLLCLRVGSHPDFERLMKRCAGLVPVEELTFGRLA